MGIFLKGFLSPSGDAVKVNVNKVGLLKSKRITLQQEDILSLNDVLFQVVPPPGSDKILFPQFMVMSTDTNPDLGYYAESGDYRISWPTPDGLDFMGTSGQLSALLGTNTPSTAFDALIPRHDSAGYDYNENYLADGGVYIWADENPTLADERPAGTLTVTTFYLVVDLP